MLQVYGCEDGAADTADTAGWALAMVNREIRNLLANKKQKNSDYQSDAMTSKYDSLVIRGEVEEKCTR